MKALIGILTCVCFFNHAIAQFTVAEIYTNNMVLQRDRDIPVWGWAREGSQVALDFNGNTYQANTKPDGSWLIELPAMPAGGPYTITVTNGDDIVQFENVVFGDVWLCSGQSNMEWTVTNSNNAAEEILNSSDPSIRHFKVSRTWSDDPEVHLEGGPWEVAGPSTTGDFSAVGYYFARELRKHHDIPVGLLNSSWGGSRIEPWMRTDIMEDFLGTDIDSYFEKMERERESAYQKVMEKIGSTAGEGEFNAAIKTGFNDRSWADFAIPGFWEAAGYEGLDGVVWIRKEITLSEAEARAGIQLHLGMIDDNDETYVNGRLAGSTQGINSYRSYLVTPELVHTGQNTILVRITDNGGRGGIRGEPDSLYYTSASGVHDLSGKWKFRVEEARISTEIRPNQMPTLLYNKMIHPIIQFPIKGVLWYQGESNARPDDDLKYRELFKTMITDWRVLWNQGDFPFLWVQLANFMAPDEEPAESSWAVLRESQSAALELPNTGEAVIIDIGEADDIHPRNKQDVGLRLSLAARKIAYNEDIVYSGPVFREAQRDGNQIILSFDHTGSGLMLPDGQELGGFAIAGEDGKYLWASGKLENGRVRLWNDEIKKPVYIRYAWGNNPDKANLYNQEGLPARPFQTVVK